MRYTENSGYRDWLRVLAFILGVAVLSAAAGTAGAAVVPDMLERAVAIPDRPLRVVSLAPSITETIYALGRGDWLVGVTDVCDYPPPARGLPKVGGIAAPNLEQIVRLRPDLVFATAEGNARDLLDQLERLGLATFALQPDSYEGVVDSILAMGRALAADQAGRRVVDDIQRRVRRVHELVAGRSRPGRPLSDLDRSTDRRRRRHVPRRPAGAGGRPEHRVGAHRLVPADELGAGGRPRP